MLIHLKVYEITIAALFVLGLGTGPEASAGKVCGWYNYIAMSCTSDIILANYLLL